MKLSRQDYQSGLPFPSPGDLPDPGIKPRSLTLQADSTVAQTIICLQCRRPCRVWSLGQKDSLGKGVVTHCSILAWRVPWTEDPLHMTNPHHQPKTTHKVTADRNSVVCSHESYKYLQLIQSVMNGEVSFLSSFPRVGEGTWLPLIHTESSIYH